MSQSNKSIHFRLIAWLVLGALLLPVTPAAGQGLRALGDPPPGEVLLQNGFRITFQGVQYDPAGASTWTYHVRDVRLFHHLNYWILALPPCAQIVSATPATWAAADPDQKTGLSGIKWTVPGWFYAGTFTVTVQGLWEPGSTSAAAKAGLWTAYGEIAGPGPSCTEKLAPAAEDDLVSTQQGNRLTIAVLSNDSDPNGDDFFLADFQANTTAGGTVARQDMGTPQDQGDDRLLYTPPAGFTGEDRFTYTISDGFLTDTGSVIIQVVTLGSPPVANADTYTVSGPSLAIPAPGILENDSIPSSVTGLAVVVSSPEHGNITLADDGSFTYQPTSGFIGTDLFSYQIQSNQGPSNTAPVTLQVPDLIPPVVTWLIPTSNGSRMDVSDGQNVMLKVEVTDNHTVNQVSFVRWDAVKQIYVVIAEFNQRPYQLELATSTLNLGWNQIYAVAYDVAGNRAEDKFIWLYKNSSAGGGEGRNYLPFISQNR
jgi:hypothetical protein